MSFKWETHRSSPNYTDNSRAYATWGRPRTIEAIAIHWWGDPNNNPSFDGIVDYLCRPGGSSAHLVATGTDRRVACIVDFDDASWATNSANPYTISIECDPRCRDEDYDVVGELIAQIRQVYGNLPLVPHRQFIATACPGNYDLNRLNAVAASKIARPEDDWGTVHNKSTPTPVVTPTTIKYEEIPRKTIELTRSTNLWNFSFASWDAAKAVTPFNAGHKADVVAIATNALGARYYMTAYSYNGGNIRATHGFNVNDARDYVAPAPAPAPAPEPEKPSVPIIVEPEVPVEPIEKPSEPSQDQEMTTLLQDVKKLLQELLALIKNVFKTGDK